MSQENVEASHRMWDRFLAGDIAGALAFLDADIEVHDVPQMPDARVYHGHAGWQTQIDKFNEAFTNLAYELLESIDGGENVVVSVVHASGEATSSGIAGDTTYAQVETWRDGRVVSMRYFMSKEDALEAMGLSE
jgi:ketosteroid isomerase-like protein